MPEPTIPELIADLKEKQAKATPLPWGLVLANTRTVDYANAAANAAPRLADEVERLTSKLSASELQIAALEESLAAKMQEVADTGRELEAQR